MTRDMRSWLGSSRLALLVLSLALDPWPALADGWVFDQERSRLGFRIVESGNRVEGTFTRWSADILYDPSTPAAARLRVRVDTGSATTGDRRRDETMAGPDWLDSARVPVALFESEGFEPLGGDRFQTTGTLRLRDGVRPVSLAFSLVPTGLDEARVSGGTMLVRTQFGVGQGQWAGQTVVGFDVSVVFDLQARRIR